jgi:hypothetical protein
MRSAEEVRRLLEDTKARLAATQSRGAMIVLTARLDALEWVLEIPNMLSGVES